MAAKPKAKRARGGKKTQAIDPSPKTEKGILDLIEQKAEFLKLLSSGLDWRTVCRYVGWDEDAVGRLMHDRPDFRHEVQKAQVSHRVDLELKVDQEAKEDADLALKVLERRYPHLWQARQKIEHMISDPRILREIAVVTAAFLDPDRYEEWLTKCEEALANIDNGDSGNAGQGALKAGS